MDVRPDIGRSTGRPTPHNRTAIYWSRMALLHIFLLLEFTLADQLVDIYFISALQVTLVIMIQLG